MRTNAYLLTLNIALCVAMGCSEETNNNGHINSTNGSGGQGGATTGSGTGGATGSAGATGAGGAADLAMCTTALKDKYPWPAVEATVSCVKTCGPDGIGKKACDKIPAATCA